MIRGRATVLLVYGILVKRIMRGHTIRIKRFFIGIWIVFCLGWVFLDLSSGQTPETTPVTSAESESSQPKSLLPIKKSRGPIIITGDNLEIDNAQKIATYTGSVKVVQGETSMFSDLLVIYLDQTGRQVEKAIATGNLRIVSGDITATGEQGTFYNTEQKLDLEKNAKVWQGNNTITAARIIVFLEEQLLEGYGDPSSERAIMTVYPPKKSLTPEQTPGQTPESPKNPTDQSSVPIVIESDTLKLDNPNQKATYTGNVVATKGLTEIRADEMIVYITKTPEAEDDVEKIEVFGNVRVVQESTTITGEKGVYLNKDQQAMIEGTAQKKARAEDKIQNMILEAPVIEAFLATKTIKAKGSTVESPGQGQRVHSVIGEGPIPTPTPKEPIKKKQSQTNKDDLPSVTLFPGKSQQGGQ